jgi:hypothetical protein
MTSLDGITHEKLTREIGEFSKDRKIQTIFLKDCLVKNII